MQLLCEKREAKFYAVLTDEVSCHIVEQMPLCIGFVDKDCDTPEEFLTFVALKGLWLSNSSSNTG